MSDVHCLSSIQPCVPRLQSLRKGQVKNFTAQNILNKRRLQYWRFSDDCQCACQKQSNLWTSLVVSPEELRGSSLCCFEMYFSHVRIVPWLRRLLIVYVLACTANLEWLCPAHFSRSTRQTEQSLVPASGGFANSVGCTDKSNGDFSNSDMIANSLDTGKDTRPSYSASSSWTKSSLPRRLWGSREVPCG